MSLSVPQSGDKSRFPEVRQPPPHGRGSANLTEPRPSGSDPSISQGHADQSRTECIPTEHIYVEVLIGFDVKAGKFAVFPVLFAAFAFSASLGEAILGPGEAQQAGAGGGI